MGGIERGRRTPGLLIRPAKAFSVPLMKLLTDDLRTEIAVSASATVTKDH